MEFDGIFSMEFHGVLGHGFPWNSMEFHGIRWNIFHGIPWSIRTWISMEFHGVFSRELSFPWSSMEFHGKRVLGPVSLKVTQSPSKDNV